MSYFIDHPDHPTVATTRELIGILHNLDADHHDKAIRLLARAVTPGHDDGVYSEVITYDGRFDENDWFTGTSQAKFNKAVIDIEHSSFTDYRIKGPWFEVSILQRDMDDPHIDLPTFQGPWAEGFTIEIIKGLDGKRYLDWAKRTGTILKMFGGA